MKLSALSVLFAVVTVGGCAPSAGTEPSDSTTGSIKDEKASYLTQCDAVGPTKAVVVAISAANEVRIFSQRGGSLVDRDIHLGPIRLPRRVAMRADGAEAAVAWGTVTGAWGVAFISLAPDGSSAELTSSITLGTQHRQAWGVAYAGDDRVVVSGAGSEHELVTLDRTAAGGFVEKARAPAPGPFTFALLPTSDPSDLVVAHVELATEGATTVNRMHADASGAFFAVGAPVFVGPPTLDLVAHPGLGVFYAQASDPTDPITPTSLDGKGVLHTLGLEGDDGVKAVGSSQTARPGTAIAIDPRGRFVVMQGNQFELDEATSTPIVRNHVLGTTTLGPTGEVTGPPVESAPSPGLLFNDMQVTASGHLLVQRVMYPATVAPGEGNRLELHAQPGPGAWKPCTNVFLPGSARLGVGR